MLINIKTSKKTEFVDITRQVEDIVADSGIKEGLCTVYVPHTTAGVTINENADPTVQMDIRMVLDMIVPDDASFGHLEGNSPAHVKSTIVGASTSIPVTGGRLVLGRWQGIFFCEFDGPRNRQFHVNITG